jgi:PAS domain S-box-containing protein
MNARYPYSGFDAAAMAGGSTPAHPDEALLREIAALRAENLRLRAERHKPSESDGSLRPLGTLPTATDELNRQIVASNPDCAKVLDLHGNVLQMTERGCHLMEIDDFEDVRDSNWIQWWPEEEQGRVRTCIHDACQGSNARFVGFARTFKGSPRWWDTVISPIRGPQGSIDMLLAISRDITEPHQQQEAVRLLNSDLESRMAQRVQELALANQQILSTLQDAQTLYNQAPCGYHSLDKQGVYLAVNDTELKWLGYSREDVIGKLSYRDITAPDQWAKVERRIERLANNGSIESTELDMLRRDGTTFPVLMSSSVIKDEQGRFVRSNTTVVDISHRKQAEVALKQNQRFLQTITDNVPGLIAYLDAGLRYRFLNAEHLNFHGMDPKLSIGRHISECLPPDAWADVAPRLQAALGGQSQRFETWRKRVDGTPVFVRASYEPDVHDGEVHGVFIQVIDITERKRIEERVTHLNDELEQRVKERSAELLESEQRFRLMVDTLREYCVFFLDANGFITDWTDSAQRMEGYSPSEMLGHHYATLFSRTNPESGREKADRNLRLAASRGQHEIHNWNARKDGSRYWSHSLLIALRDERGDLKGFAKINRDMSDAKRLDDLMRNINEELENRVAERTEQLLAANKDLESFSYSVSHDLRSPLRHISSFVSLLEEHLGEQRDDVSSRYLNTIGSSARHMSQLIDGLLAFSRLGRSAINPSPVDLSLLVGTVVAQLGHDTGGRVVDWVLAPDLPVVQGDALLLREVWANLLGNAYKYSRTRERTRIEVGWSVDPAAGYTFFVRDNGVGFDTKYASKLFGVFQRLHRASEFEGTGIGLALTRRIVERHGGSIWADSQVGEGSVFYFSLPFEGLHAPESKRDSMFAELTL